MKGCQAPNDVFYGPPGTETLQDSCDDYGGSHTYVGPVETIQLICRTLGTFTLHLVTYAEDSAFGSTLFDHNSNTIPTGTTDATITCAEATATAVPPTATATATPTATSAPVRVGGEAEVHLGGGSAPADAAGQGDGARDGLALGLSAVVAVALTFGASAWYVGARRRR